jgi:hypothetical protein
MECEIKKELKIFVGQLRCKYPSLKLLIKEMHIYDKQYVVGSLEIFLDD